MKNTTANKTLIRRFYEEVINRRNLHLIEEFVAEGFVDHNPDPGQGPGRESLKPMFQGFVEAFPDMTMSIQTMVAEGDLVGSRVAMTGTHLGNFAGTPATGRSISVSGMDWARVKDGKIVERWGVFDMAGMAKQIGLVPGPSSDDLKKQSRRYYEMLAGSKGDLASLKSELLHDQHQFHITGQAPLSTEVMQQMISSIWKAFPDLSHEITNQICEGNVVFNHLKATATHKGEFAGVKATNNAVTYEAMVSHRWEGGKLIEQWVEPDFMALMVQIGAIPAPTA
jgi:steroid delta-isomerase-like uncharacterized protein